MIGKFVKDKVYVFIDAANLFYAQHTLGWKISYEKLIRYFKRECGKDTKCFVSMWLMMKQGKASGNF